MTESLLLALKSFDLALFDQIKHSLQNSFFDKVMPLISNSGDWGLVWVVFSVVLLLMGRTETKKAAILMLVALLTSFLAGEEWLKQLFQRPRPFLSIPGVELLVPPPHTFSFPSGHAANAFASGLVLARKVPALACPSLFLAVAMAFSRVYVGVHYPLDVLAGSLLGAACALLVLKLEPAIFRALGKIPRFSPH